MLNDLPENIYSVDCMPTKAQANNKGKVLWYAKGHGWYLGWFQTNHVWVVPPTGPMRLMI
jgi:hypothetical protein